MFTCTTLNIALSNISNGTGKFWVLIKNKRKSSSIAAQMCDNGQDLDNPMDIVIAFAKFFSESFLPSSDVVICRGAGNLTIRVDCFNECQVLNALKEMKSKITTVPDDVP